VVYRIQKSRHNQDISPLSYVDPCKNTWNKKKTFVADIMTLDTDKYDTILLLMNGIIWYYKSTVYSKQIKISKPNGQISIALTSYMFDEDEDGAMLCQQACIMVN
jgi:hypothetical protein